MIRDAFLHPTANGPSSPRPPSTAGRASRRSEAGLRIDADMSSKTPDTDWVKGGRFAVGLPETFFRTTSGEPVCFIEAAQEPGALAAGDAPLDDGNFAPLALPSASPRGRNWKIALAASVVLHLSAAAVFLIHPDEGVEIAGAPETGISSIGNASADQVAAGGVINVTIAAIPMVEAQPVVENTRPEADDLSDNSLANPTLDPAHAEPVETQSTVASQVDAEKPLTPVREPLASEAPEAATTTMPADAAPVISAEPEILSAPTHTEAPDPVSPAPAKPVEQTNAITSSKALEAAFTPFADEMNPALLPVEDDPELAAQAPAPKPRPDPAQVRKAEKPTPAPIRKRKQASRSSTSGSAGRNKSDAKRGEAQGSQAGQTAGSGKSSIEASAAGNAAVSNYPGKIVRKLRHALRYPPAARSRRLKGEVRVQFVVSGSGAASALRIAASSGSDILDQAALDTVRRAAPFPPIPAAAGRSSWSFTVPLAFVR